jgi:hypothetical protein
MNKITGTNTEIIKRMLPETCCSTEPCTLFAYKSAAIQPHFRTNHVALYIFAVKIFLYVYCTINNEGFILFDVF